MDISVVQTGVEFSKTEMAILMRYGITLSHEQIADFFKKAQGTIYQKVHEESFPLKAVKVKLGAAEKRGTRLYDFRDVAKYWDNIHDASENLQD